MDIAPTPQNTVPAALPMAITMEAQEWNLVIDALSNAPYRVAAPLIGKITAQLTQLAAAHREPAPVGIDGRLPNGADGEAIPGAMR